MKWGFIVLLVLLVLPICFAGSTQFKDLYEISNKSITRNDTMRAFEAYRFRFNGAEVKLTIDTMTPEKVYFSIISNTYEDKEFALEKFSKKSFDLDNDGLVDFTFGLDEIIMSNTKRRITTMFSTEEAMGIETFELDDIPIVEDDTVVEEDVKPKNITTENLTDDYELLLDQEEEVEDDSKPMSSMSFNLVIWLIVLLIVVVIGGAFFLLYKKHHEIL